MVLFDQVVVCKESLYFDLIQRKKKCCSLRWYLPKTLVHTCRELIGFHFNNWFYFISLNVAPHKHKRKKAITEENSVLPSWLRTKACCVINWKSGVYYCGQELNISQRPLSTIIELENFLQDNVISVLEHFLFCPCDQFNHKDWPSRRTSADMVGLRLVLCHLTVLLADLFSSQGKAERGEWGLNSRSLTVTCGETNGLYDQLRTRVFDIQATFWIFDLAARQLMLP